MKDLKKYVPGYGIAKVFDPDELDNIDDISKLKMNGMRYYLLEDYEKAINYFNDVILNNPKDLLIGNMYILIGRCYLNLENYPEAINNFQKLFGDDAKQNFNASIELAECYLYMREYDKSISYIEESIKIKPCCSLGYIKRGITYYLTEKYKESIDDFTKALNYHDDVIGNGRIGDDKGYSFADLYYFRGISNYKIKDYNQAINDFTNAIEKDSLKNNNWFYYASRAACFNRKGEFDNSINDLFEATKQDIGSINTFLCLCGELDKITMNRIDDLIGHFYNEGKSTDCLRILKMIETKLSFTAYSKWNNRLYYMTLLGAKSSETVENELFVHEEQESITMANLSHAIKSILSSIITPLQILKEEKQYKEVIIDNALKGAEIIRQTVNAMNLSFRGDVSDFKYDVKRSNQENSFSIKNIILESLKHSVSNMFDSKYFGNFMRNYFPNKEIYSKAKNKWNQTTSTEDITKFVKEYMFDFSLDIREAKDLFIGNEKGSAIKFQILFQEIILNAVKYVSFLEREKRKISIEFKIKKGNVVFKAENSYQKGQGTKSTGLGHIIIENFAKLLNTKPIIQQNGNYVVSISFRNLWTNTRKDQK